MYMYIFYNYLLCSRYMESHICKCSFTTIHELMVLLKYQTCPCVSLHSYVIIDICLYDKNICGTRRAMCATVEMASSPLPSHHQMIQKSEQLVVAWVTVQHVSPGTRRQPVRHLNSRSQYICCVNIGSLLFYWILFKLGCKKAQFLITIDHFLNKIRAK